METEVLIRAAEEVASGLAAEPWILAVDRIGSRAISLLLESPSDAPQQNGPCPATSTAGTAAGSRSRNLSTITRPVFSS